MHQALLLEMLKHPQPNLDSLTVFFERVQEGSGTLAPKGAEAPATNP